MAQRAPRPCAWSGCPALVAGGRYCQTHASQVEQRRGTAHARGYTRRWTDHYRPWFLGRNPLCGDRLPGAPATTDSVCASTDRPRAATLVDHIVPHRGDQQLFWNPMNHQSLCDECHNKKRAREASR